MPTNSQLKTVVFAVVAIALLTRVDATRDLVIGKKSFF
jgi:hypothetical protein